MNDFISIIRTDRAREIKKYKDKGYSFIDEKKYRFIEKIEVIQEENLAFGVEATERDVYFYIIDAGANAYFSIIEIYKLLLEIIKKEDRLFVTTILEQQLKMEIVEENDSNNENKKLLDNQEAFFYRGIKYNTKKHVELSKNGRFSPMDSSASITYNQFFTLINLIQEKSNALFLRGTENKQYKNGLIRFLLIMLIGSGDIQILMEIGWHYDNGNKCFSYSKPTTESNRSKRKYYLTEKEYADIIRMES